VSDIRVTEGDPPAVETPAPEFFVSQAPAVGVEIMMDSGRVAGELHPTGAPRRLVDTLNSVDAGFIMIYNGHLDDPFTTGEPPRRFDVAHIGRNAILFAAPRGDSVSRGSPFDAVKKLPVETIVVVPGFEIRGNMFFLPDADPPSMPMLTSHHFIPLTEATVLATAARLAPWREPVLVVNLSRALLYAPRKVS